MLKRSFFNVPFYEYKNVSVTCPKCNGSAMATWKKAFLSPLAAMPCESCGAELRVTWSSYLKAIALGSIIFLLGYLQFDEGSLNQYLAFAVGFVLMLAGQIYFMPIDLGDTDPEKTEASDEVSEQDPN